MIQFSDLISITASESVYCVLELAETKASQVDPLIKEVELDLPASNSRNFFMVQNFYGR
jgi:hypothetical protein